MSVDEVMAAILQDLPGRSIERRRNPGPSAQDSLLVGADALVEVMAWLRSHEGFDLLSNVSGVDWPDPALADKVAVSDGGETAGGGFVEVVYHLFSTAKRVGPLLVRARTADRVGQCVLPSVVGIFRSAEFQEREIYDLFGVQFTGHPDLRRILMWDEFADHPMRKDYVAPDDYEYEPTPHDAVLERASAHYPASPTPQP